jgi:acyl-CoA synthetase (AMP-forming)/AMP-acid ligase II/pimeloyl-ACP methyl ester carboxylesterase
LVTTHRPHWPGVDPAWSRHVDVPSTAAADPAGTTHRWHVLDNGPALAELGVEPAGTLLCVHGNPTWSYLWRTLLAAGTSPKRPWRVVAVDQLDMGFSVRTGRMRRLADRITDLGDLTEALGLTGPIITVGHDWGGVISLGWALAHRTQLAGVVLTNTAVHQPPQYPIPPALRLALHPAVHSWGTTTTAAFLRVTHALAHPRLRREVAAALMSPYRNPARRAGVGNFVADIPVDPSHPSFAALNGVAEGIRSLDVPALLLWGPRDPIFSDRYLRDLLDRLPEARVHRFEGAGHLLAEDVDVAGAVFSWLGDVFDGGTVPAGPTPALDAGEASPRAADTGTADPDAIAAPGATVTGIDTAGIDTAGTGTAAGEYVPLWSELDRRSSDSAPAVVDMAPLEPAAVTAPAAEATAGARVLSWAELSAEVDRLTHGLTAAGVRPGQRISLLVPPGSVLTALIYACLRLGAVIVLADAGLGARGLSRAVKGAGPDFVIGIDRALLAARVFGWPGQRISVAELPAVRRKLLGVELSLEGMSAAAQSDPNAAALAPESGPATYAATLPPEPNPDATAAVLFTSGSTGPAKGVLYTHRQLAAMRDTLAATYKLMAGTSLVAGFAPFALLGPALGATSVTPAMDVTAPKTLTARALAAAAAAVQATVVFLSPAALRNVLATAADLSARDREALDKVSLLLSAGAPVPSSLLKAAAELMPNARLHTPYGMTEALPVTDIELQEILAAEADAGADEVPGAGNGVCVGSAVPGASVAISALDAAGEPVAGLTTAAGLTGEIVVRAPHVKDGYDRLWLTQRVSARNPGWHRTGDVGHLDAHGRLWVEGRLAHIITTADGVLTPVSIEQLVEDVPGVGRAGAVGVGPAGRQVAVAVVETSPAAARPALAPAELSERIRNALASADGPRIAAVLTVPELPTDVRHNAKVDRARLAAWAGRALAGGRMGRP